MAKNPDRSVELTTFAGSTRSLDDWATMFHLCLVVLPDRPEAKKFLPVVDRLFEVFGDADCRTAIVVPSTKAIAERIVGYEPDKYLTFVDPESKLVKELGLTHLPAFVHLRQDTQLVDAAEGWDATAWQRVADGVARSMAWSSPDLSRVQGLPSTPGWAA